MILYLLNGLHNKQPFSLFKAINIDVSDNAAWHTILIDMIVSSVIGGIAVYYLTSPTPIPQAIVAGLGMTGVLSAHAVPKEGSKGE